MSLRLVLPLLLTLVVHSHNAVAETHILSQQCWHQYPLATVNVISSTDGNHEIVQELDGSTTKEANPPVSGTKAQTEHGLWSYPPICTDVLQSMGSKLCVYTNTSFSNGRGISIFTTPKIAEDFATLPPFRDPTALQDINTFSGHWYTEELPGKGMGMLAKNDLNFKDRVTAYTPALLAYLEDELPTMEREKYFRIAVTQLPDATRKMYEGLATVYGYPQIKYQDVVKANTFQLEVGGQNHLSIFPETSRLNHACSPNAQYYLDPTLLTHFVHITRPVAKGEEITISYTSPLEPTETRQQHLSQGFHFTCTCLRCTVASTTDATLSTIQDLQKSLNAWSGDVKNAPKATERLLQLYRDEGLEGFMDIPYGFAALAYNAVGDSKTAVKYARKAEEAVLMKDGEWAPNLKIWRELISEPKKHWSYERGR